MTGSGGKKERYPENKGFKKRNVEEGNFLK